LLAQDFINIFSDVSLSIQIYVYISAIMMWKLIFKNYMGVALMMPCY
jgi:hypothetical protein